MWHRDLDNRLVRITLMATPANNHDDAILTTNVDAPIGATYMPTRVSSVSPIVLLADANSLNLRAGKYSTSPNLSWFRERESI